MPLLLTVEQAAKELGLSRAKLADLVSRGVVPSIKIDRSRRIVADELRAWVERLAEEQGQGGTEM